MSESTADPIILWKTKETRENGKNKPFTATPIKVKYTVSFWGKSTILFSFHKMSRRKINRAHPLKYCGACPEPATTLGDSKPQQAGLRNYCLLIARIYHLNQHRNNEKWPSNLSFIPEPNTGIASRHCESKEGR